MPDNRRARRRLLVFALALPIFAVVYATTFGGRLWAALRPAVATFLGATVIGSVYAEEAAKRAPATPMRALAVIALAVALIVPAASPARVAAADPAEAVIAAAESYLGSGFRLGTEGPRTFDCSGLMYRIFSDAGELPRVSGMRLRAAGYMRWFTSRGLFTRNEAEARRGDLVIYNNGEHMGIYLGNGKVLSALVEPWGVSIHRLNGINQNVSYFLRVNWGRGDGNGTDNGKPEKPDKPKPDKPEQPNSNKPDKTKPDKTKPDSGSTTSGENARPDRFTAIALGTMNLRTAADPAARIIGWVGRNAEFKIIDRGQSPAGYDWFQIETQSGKQGWVYSRWVRE